MAENILIDPRFAKPKNLIGLEDPEEEVTASGAVGLLSTGLPEGSGTPGSDSGTPGQEGDPSFAAPTFTITSQELVLDSFGNYRVNAVLTVSNAIEGAIYELRMAPA